MVVLYSSYYRHLIALILIQNRMADTRTQEKNDYEFQYVEKLDEESQNVEIPVEEFQYIEKADEEFQYIEKPDEESQYIEKPDINVEILPKTEEEIEKEQLEWINLREAIALAGQNYTFRDTVIRKTKENPFVPIGLLTTSGIFLFGLWTMASGQPKKSQMMMRWLIAAEGFTVFAFYVGLHIKKYKKPKPN